MKTITVISKVVIKQVVTESYKNKLISEVQDKVKHIEAEMELFNKEAQKAITELTIKGHPQINAVKEQINEKKAQNEEIKTQYIEKIKELSMLNIDEEVVQGTLDSPVELKVGDNIEDITTKEIVVKDGVIVDIK